MLAKACELFIKELSLRSWFSVEEVRRKVLQRQNVCVAVSRSEMFDFLIDIVPRDDVISGLNRLSSTRHAVATNDDDEND